MPIKFFLILFVFSSFPIFSQSYKINLDSLTIPDDLGVHLVIVAAEPKENLIYPRFSKNEMPLTKKYLNLFYTWDSETDQNISVLVYQLKDEDLLYVDKNNDNDLSNDGKPILFPVISDTVSFEITSPKDSNQKLVLALFRKPSLPDSEITYFLDHEGNIAPRFLKFARIYSDDFNYEGKKRSFFFDYRVSLRRGVLKIGKSEFSVGLFDYSNNGLYNDERDLFLIDHNKTGKLNTDICAPASDNFAINDVFPIGDKNYKLSEIEKYGKYVVIEETKDPISNNYLKWVQRESSKGETKGILSTGFWDKKLVNMKGEIKGLSEFKGKYLFLNVWGEWCLPCINEIEELKIAYEKNKDKIIFLGLLKPNDLTKAEETINNKKIPWVNLIISDEMIEEFSIKGYPSNILIFPDGINYIKENNVNRTFFDLNIK